MRLLFDGDIRGFEGGACVDVDVVVWRAASKGLSMFNVQRSMFNVGLSKERLGRSVQGDCPSVPKKPPKRITLSPFRAFGSGDNRDTRNRDWERDNLSRCRGDG